MKKKITAVILVLTIMLPLYACSDETNTSSAGDNESVSAIEYAEVEETTTSYLDSLPELDMEGMELRILGVDYDTRRNFPASAENGELVNDALFARNRTVEETYNVKIANYSEEQDGSVTTKAQKSVTAGDDEYDVLISTISGTMTTLSLGGCLYNLNNVPYIALSEGWWSREVYNNMQLNGKLYFTLSDFAPMKFYAPYVMCYNTDIAADYNIGDLTQNVINGDWTIDMLANISKDISHDLDGDGVMTVSDFWAYAHVKTSITTYSHYTGAGMKLCDIDSNGKPVVNLDNEKSLKVIEKISQFLGKGMIEYSDMNETNDMFIEGRALFYGNSTSNIIANFREMKDNFSIIPCPKYDEKQEFYYNYINTYVRGGVAIPTTCSKIDNVGLLLEVLAYLSYGDVRNALFETTMKQKVARDEASGMILDMVFDNCYIDLNGVYNFGKSAETIGSAVMEKKEFVSSYAKIKDQIQASIDDTISKFS